MNENSGICCYFREEWEEQRKPTRPGPAGEQTMRETSVNKTIVCAETRDGDSAHMGILDKWFQQHPARSQSITCPVPRE